MGTWLFRLAVRAAWRLRRRQASRAKHEVSGVRAEIHEAGLHRGMVRRWAVEPKEGVLQHEASEQVEQAIARLPEAYRVVFLLAQVEGLSGPETGSVLGLSVAAVKSRLHRARLRLRKELAPYFAEMAA